MKRQKPLNLEQDSKMHVNPQDPYCLELQQVNSTWRSKEYDQQREKIRYLVILLLQMKYVHFQDALQSLDFQLHFLKAIDYHLL